MSRIKVLFVCHGNICRSPMAEYILKDMVEKAGCHRDVADPWYTGDFETTYNDLIEGCKAFLSKL